MIVTGWTVMDLYYKNDCDVIIILKMWHNIGIYRISVPGECSTTGYYFTANASKPLEKYFRDLRKSSEYFVSKQEK